MYETDNNPTYRLYGKLIILTILLGIFGFVWLGKELVFLSHTKARARIEDAAIVLVDRGGRRSNGSEHYYYTYKYTIGNKRYTGKAGVDIHTGRCLYNCTPGTSDCHCPNDDSITIVYSNIFPRFSRIYVPERCNY